MSGPPVFTSDTRQKEDVLFSSLTSLLGAGVTLGSGIFQSDGYSVMDFLILSDQPFQVRIQEAGFSAGPFVQTSSLASTLDATSGLQKVSARVAPTGAFMQAFVDNLGLTEKTLQVFIGGLPVGGSSGVGGQSTQVIGTPNKILANGTTGVPQSGAVTISISPSFVGAPVIGDGTGLGYPTIAAAIAGETSTEIPGNVPQAGSGPGVLVGPGTLSAVDNFYKDWWIVNTSAVPSQGMSFQYARVSNYVGATRTFTLDKPWDFSAEATFSVIDPAKISLNQDVQEDVVISKPLTFNLSGNRLKGKIDISAANFAWVRGGGGYVTNGIQKTDAGVLKVNECTVSRRDATIYALLMTEGSNLGRCDLVNSEFDGRVSGRRGIMGWSIQNCRNYGLADGVSDIPCALVESIAGIAVTLTNLDVAITSGFSGCVVYSENSVTGTAFISVVADIDPTVVPTKSTAFTSARPEFSMWRASGAGVITVTVSSGYNIFKIGLAGVSVDGFGSPPLVFAFCKAVGLTGSIALTLTGTTWDVEILDSGVQMAIIETAGADTTGPITLTSGQIRFLNFSSQFTGVLLGARLVNTITCGSTLAHRGGNPFGTVFISFSAAQDNALASVSISGPYIVDGGITNTVLLFTYGAAVSAGTYTISGSSIYNLNAFQNVAECTSSVSGGTFSVSGQNVIYVLGRLPNSTGILGNHAGTGGTLTLSNSWLIVGLCIGSLVIARAAGNGASVTVSNAVTIKGFRFAAVYSMVTSTIAGGSALFTGNITYQDCKFESAVTFMLGTAGTIQGPQNPFEFSFCNFASTVTTQSGAGTITWTGVTLRYKHCHFEGLYTVVYTAFGDHQAFFCRFNGASGNKSISGSGTRPAILYYWSCSFAQRYDDILPEVINVYDVLPAQAALVRGQPVKVNAANQYQVCVAASVVDGVLLAAAGAAGTFAVAVRQGRVFVNVNPAVANGDNLVLDTATPTRAITAASSVAGQEIGTALEAAGATNAGQAYTAVNVR